MTKPRWSAAVALGVPGRSQDHARAVSERARAMLELKAAWCGLLAEDLIPCLSMTILPTILSGKVGDVGSKPLASARSLGVGR